MYMTLLSLDKPVIFQSWYRVSVEEFHPFIHHCPNTPQVINDNENKFTMHIRLEHDPDEQRSSELLIQTFHLIDELPKPVGMVLSGETHVNWDAKKNKMRDKYVRALEGVRCNLDELSNNALNTFCWKMGLMGGPSKLETEWWMLRWQHHFPKTDGRSFVKHKMFLENMVQYGDSDLYTPDAQHLSMSHKDREHIETLLSKSNTRPLYHDLFREAWVNLSSNPKSALVIGVASCETAFKTTLVDLNPEWGWVVSGRQSPPLIEMLRHATPNLSAKNRINGSVLRPPKSVISDLQKAVTLRNQVVHGEDVKVSFEDAENALLKIKDVLYLLDFYRGHEWAFNLISKSTSSMLKTRNL